MIPEKELVKSIMLPADRLLTDDDHPTADCLSESEFLEHYGQFYYMRKDYDRTGESIVAVHKRTPCINWMMCSGYFQMRDSKQPLRWKGNPPFDMAAHVKKEGFERLYPEEGFYHRCKDVWGGSWFGRWALISVMREESNLDLWTVCAAGNDDMSYSYDIIGKWEAMEYMQKLRKLPYNTITPEWCSENGWYFTN